MTEQETDGLVFARVRLEKEFSGQMPGARSLPVKG
jgi:hypothetical protein